jgi:hypothetical protein
MMMIGKGEMTSMEEFLKTDEEENDDIEEVEDGEEQEEEEADVEEGRGDGRWRKKNGRRERRCKLQEESLGVKGEDFSDCRNVR